jgi:ornithine carbamoyltransferase
LKESYEETKLKDFLTLRHFNDTELHDLLHLALRLKKVKHPFVLNGKTLAMLFAKTSTRTRVSFEVAMTQLGGHAMNLKWEDTNFVKGDFRDEAKVLGLYCDAVMARVPTHQQLVEVAKGCEKPVINGMDDLYHPCQALADLLTILEAKKHFDGLKVAWVGDGTNVCNSLMIGAEMTGMKMHVATPPGFEPKVQTSATVLQDPLKAANDADVLVTDTWVSLGLESEKAIRLQALQPYQVNSRLLHVAKEDCIVLHCLPAQRNYEITSAVLDSPQSRVFQEAENRLHTAKALLLHLLARDAF